MATEAHDYTDFDQKMLARIKSFPATAAALSIALDAEAKLLIKRPGEEFRVIDRRLQALRKNGVIAWERCGGRVVWTVTS